MITKFLKINYLESAFLLESELFENILEFEDLMGWTSEINKVASNMVLLNHELNLDNNIEMISEALETETKAINRKLIVSRDFLSFLIDFNEFYFNAYSKGFVNDDDLENYLEVLGHYTPINSFMDEGKILIKYCELLSKKLYNEFYNLELDIITKTKIILNFLENYEGVDTNGNILPLIKQNSIYAPLFENETFGELLDHLTNWFNELIMVDEEGNPSEFPNHYLIMDLIDWRV